MNDFPSYLEHSKSVCSLPVYFETGFSHRNKMHVWSTLLYVLVEGCLIFQAWKLWKDGTPEELIDPLILESCNKSEALQCIHVAMLCVQSSAIQRPTMSSVVFMLEGENTSLPQPSEHDITSLSSVEMDLIMEGREINVSSNDVTVTEVSGR